MRGLPQRGLLVGQERRRTPRFCCAGRAEIRCLPSDGTLLAGELRNLGLGGCYIETASPFRFGTRAEILVRVNTASFRAMGLVKAVHHLCGIAVQFIRMSPGGHAILEDLLFEMARLRVAMSTARLVRRGERLQRVSDDSRAIVLTENAPIIGTVLPPEPIERALVRKGKTKVADLEVITRILDLFA